MLITALTNPTFLSIIHPSFKVSSSAPIAFPDFALEVGSPSCALSKALYWGKSIFCPCCQVITVFHDNQDQIDDVGDADVTVVISTASGRSEVVGSHASGVEAGRVVRKGGMATCQLLLAGPCIAA